MKSLSLLFTLTLPKTNIGGYINTGWDLVSNLVGVVVACTEWRPTTTAVPKPPV